MDIREWESKDKIIKNKGNQVIARLEEAIGVRSEIHWYGPQRVVTMGIGDGLTKQELANFVNQILHRSKTYFIYDIYIYIYIYRERERERERQRVLVREYHQGKTNHRGLIEMLARWKREYYWINKPGTIKEVLAMCEVYLQAKYIR